MQLRLYRLKLEIIQLSHSLTPKTEIQFVLKDVLTNQTSYQEVYLSH